MQVEILSYFNVYGIHPAKRTVFIRTEDIKIAKAIEGTRTGFRCVELRFKEAHHLYGFSVIVEEQTWLDILTSVANGQHGSTEVAVGSDGISQT